MSVVELLKCTTTSTSAYGMSSRQHKAGIAAMRSDLRHGVAVLDLRLPDDHRVSTCWKRSRPIQT